MSERVYNFAAGPAVMPEDLAFRSVREYTHENAQASRRRTCVP